MSVWVGIDLGTQSVRAMAVTGDGEVLGTAARPLTSRRDGDRHEQDPERWWDQLAAACAEALANVEPARVAGVAVDATSGTILLTTKDGAPVTPALMYDDRRAAAELDRVNDVGGQVWARLGYQRMQANWALPKLLWLLRSAGPGVRLAHQSDFVTRRLAGEPVATDLSNALKTGVDLIAEDWPTAVMDALGVPPDVLPPVVRPGARIGSVCARAARETGLPEGTPILAGTTDGCAAQLGAGAIRVGSWNSVLGTTLVLKGVTRDLIHDPLGVVYSHRAPDGSWLPGGASSTGTGVLSAALPGRDLTALSREATIRDHATRRSTDRERTGRKSGDHARAGRGSADREGSGLEGSGRWSGNQGRAGRSVPSVIYPLVSPGERFPFAAADARSFTLGTPADDVETYMAILRGAAYVERLCFDYLDLLGAPVDGEIILTGGATRSAYGNQLRADVLGRPVTLRETAEPALGMAALAASADLARTREIVEPRPRDAEPYLRFVEELRARGWLDERVARHATERTRA
ncbi:FGGY-family carbohydrate kinase [Nonomuraea sp. NPDC059007]|uniref:FGGY-family carbohydrate kinase n=1 Tax=Nonomuraea sp. NPDC059007 TaxID=3346692 RepID=UPI00367785E6